MAGAFDARPCFQPPTNEASEMSLVNSNPEKMNLSFSGCGFLCIYHAGVAAAIKEYAPQLTKNKISGASAGSIIAAGLICNVCISQATSTVLTVVSQARSRIAGPIDPRFDLMGIVRTELKRVFPSDAWKRCTDHLYISLTRWRDKKNVVVSVFENNEELIDAIICSCFIPFYCGMNPPYYRGEQYIDGGFTDNQPTLDEHSIMVSPFSGESDICPPDWDSASFLCIDFSRTSIRLTTRNLFRLTACLMPASLEDCSKMCLQGFEDALRFLTKNGMAPCIRCLTIQNIDESERETDSIADSSRALSPPMGRIRTRSTSNLQSVSSRKRGESECDTCCESEHMYNAGISSIFPVVIREKFEEAARVESSFLEYLGSFRIVKMTRSALGLTKLPIDMMLLVAKNLSLWASQVIVPEWLKARISRLVNFIYDEFENQKAAYSARFSCQLSLADEPSRWKRNKLLDSIELSEDAKRERALLRARDRRNKKIKVEPQATARVSREWSYMPEADLDSTDHVVEFMRGHDSMYEFHYRDEQNKVHSFGLFNMQHPEKRHACHVPHDTSSSAPSCSHSHSPLSLARAPRPVSMVVEEDEEAHKYDDDEVDSGLSVEERTVKQTRDACCSPVRDFLYQQQLLRAGPPGGGPPGTPHGGAGGGGGGGAGGAPGTPHSSRPAARFSRAATVQSRNRHPPAHPSHAPRKAAAPSREFAAVVSSDSEAELGEQFFVPRPRQRASSREYEGEPEQSDTDR